MKKYKQVREIVQLGILNRRTKGQDSDVRSEFRVSPLVSMEDLTLTHCPTYVSRFLAGDLTKDEIRNVGFPWSLSGVDRALSSVGGTVEAAVSVCEEWRKKLLKMRVKDSTDNLDDWPCWGAHVAGGTHHAFHDRGEGFCVFSDIAVAANVILQRYPDLVKRVLILDLDVHQGNGNAVLFQNRPEVFTFSLHCSANYFSEKQQSDLDIELPAGCNDETYLMTLRHWLKQIKQLPDSFDFIFFQAGVDILEHDRLGQMNITAEGIYRRNNLVFEFARKELNVPLVVTMGGGYPVGDDWRPTLNAHANVYLQAFDFLREFRKQLN